MYFQNTLGVPPPPCNVLFFYINDNIHLIFMPNLIMSLIYCTLCERDFNPFDYAFHIWCEIERSRVIAHNQRRLPDIPIVNFDIGDENPFLTPPPTPFSPMLFFPEMSPPSSPIVLPQELFTSTPVKKVPASPRLNDSMELPDPTSGPWRYFPKRLFSGDDDDGPEAKKIA